MQTHHHIFANEADQTRPLAYVQVFPAHRRRGGYFAAGATGAVLTLAALVILGFIAGAMSAVG